MLNCNSPGENAVKCFSFDPESTDRVGRADLEGRGLVDGALLQTAVTKTKTWKSKVFTLLIIMDNNREKWF